MIFKIVDLEWMLEACCPRAAVVDCVADKWDEICTYSVYEIVTKSCALKHECVGRLAGMTVTIFYLSSFPVVSIIFCITATIVDAGLGEITSSDSGASRGSVPEIIHRSPHGNVAQGRQRRSMRIDVLYVRGSEEKGGRILLLLASADVVQLIHSRQSKRTEFRHIEMGGCAETEESDVDVQLSVGGIVCPRQGRG